MPPSRNLETSESSLAVLDGCRWKLQLQKGTFTHVYSPGSAWVYRGNEQPPHLSGSQGQRFAYPTCLFGVGCSYAPHSSLRDPGWNDDRFHLEHCSSCGRGRHWLFFLEVTYITSHVLSARAGHVGIPEFKRLSKYNHPTGGAVNIDEQKYNLWHHSSAVSFLSLKTRSLGGESWRIRNREDIGIKRMFWEKLGLWKKIQIKEASG